MAKPIIEVGKKYLNAAGQHVEIVANYDTRNRYTFVGFIVGAQQPIMYNDAGDAARGERIADLVEEIRVPREYWIVKYSGFEYDVVHTKSQLDAMDEDYMEVIHVREVL